MTDPLANVDWAVLGRYLTGESDATEVAAVEAWIKGAPEREQLVAGLRLAGTTVREQRGAWDADAATRHIAARVSAQRSMPKATAPRAIWWRTPMAMGAAAIAVIGLVGVMLTRVVSTAHEAQPIREFATAAGSRSTVVLRDGTRVILAPESRIQIPADFGRASRAIVLDGEAYFSVVHNSRHPFAVRIGGTTVTDVGTEFDVRGYAEESAVRVAVAGGIVVVGAGQGTGAARARPALAEAPVMLRAGDAVTITDHGVMVRHGIDVPDLAAWTQGRLVFDETPLSEVVRDLSRTFDLSITVADSSLATHRITGSFADESADDVLTDVVKIVGGRYDRNGRRVVITRASVRMEGHDGARPAPLTTAALRGNQG